MTWQKRGACRDEDPELFHPVSDLLSEQIERARAVCRSCPVYAECLDYVVTNPAKARYGIWAATTESERRAMRTPERTAVR
ncbi:WhiB family transcriptional regulator [Sphaerisporangium album]|uniref:WhiB family transcriptional regulator n=1 Tax=Sphaerisporangium album TaxID=509200 RepID=A0A367FBH7_9ACTN|nr:WhiB family transcriptional regulator [Sphaerisporangium album]RCG27222.1 WhiB family transcriptional regulator [Sphaerisporangium album]